MDKHSSKHEASSLLYFCSMRHSHYTVLLILSKPFKYWKKSRSNFYGLLVFCFTFTSMWVPLLCLCISSLFTRTYTCVRMVCSLQVHVHNTNRKHILNIFPPFLMNTINYTTVFALLVTVYIENNSALPLANFTNVSKANAPRSVSI